MKLYLGDSVYVDRWEDGLVLTTENGGMPSNQIFLEPETIAALFAYVARLSRQEHQQHQQHEPHKDRQEDQRPEPAVGIAEADAVVPPPHDHTHASSGARLQAKLRELSDIASEILITTNDRWRTGRADGILEAVEAVERVLACSPEPSSWRSVERQAAAWRETNTRSDDALAYCQRYLMPKALGRHIWHVILDDAISLRAENDALKVRR